jgi:catechol 2,3-dioxygenase-like lactoylglutathione lyase family enzyme
MIQSRIWDMKHATDSVRWLAGAVFMLRVATGGTAAQVPTPATPLVGACHVSPIVENLDRSAHFYHDLLGLDLVPAAPLRPSDLKAGEPLPWDTDPGHLHLHGLPQARLRFIGARMPNVRCGVEIVEFGDVERHAVRRRIQDPGAATLILLVRDLDAAFAPLKRAGVPVVTTGGAPISMSATNKTRAVIVQDPDGHFVELAQVDPLPATTVAARSNIIGIRLRLTVADVQGTATYYEKLLGVQ